MPSERFESNAAGVPHNFRTTHWSVVLQAGQTASPEGSEALEELCRTYWYPLYAFVRRRGYEVHEAQDLTQAFFQRFLERSYLESVDRRKGKFRTFLLRCLDHFLSNEWDRSQTRKRGGGCVVSSLDAECAEARYRLELTDELTPEKVYDRRWAQILVQTVIARLGEEFSGPQERFEQLKGLILDEPGSSSYAQAAAAAGMSEQAVKSAVHRMRRRFRELCRVEIGKTVETPDQIDEEIRNLFAAVS
ncbi:MAG: sigma-70 family RNA polymerase sigma factor [Verrucomicrobia subdivision 3 bacterium]|nr:sigma-70 family RNA polymerase sigma factor [Limisphaerales bacterium]